ncbi:MAG: hypothetical protein S4CHLAM123_10200 [Chlamydiales bacterium]|nr:hypothetical protein [Chlamydiales bacterium]
MSIHNHNYDVVVVGAGPAGMATAGALKVLNKNLRICVLDKRAETRRHYGLKLAKDSMNDLINILKSGSCPEDSKELTQLLERWKSKTLKVSVIEDELTKKAEDLGVRVIRNEEYTPHITPENLGNLLGGELAAKNEGLIQKELREIFSEAKVIVGADGRHSAVRKAAMGLDECVLVDRQEMSYVLEIKCEVPVGVERVHGRKINSLEDTLCEGVRFVTRGRGNEEATQPLSVHYFVGKKTFEAFKEANDAQPWDLETLELHAQTDPIVQSQLAKIKHSIEKVTQDNGEVTNVRIKRLPISVYRSREAVKLYKERIVTLVGDAHKGAVLQRGVNLAFKEAGMLAKAIDQYFLIPPVDAPAEIPTEFKVYQAAVQKLFKRETFWARIKTGALNAARKIVQIIAPPLHVIRNAVQDPAIRQALAVVSVALLALVAITLAFQLTVGLSLSILTVGGVWLKIGLPLGLFLALQLGLRTRQAIDLAQPVEV